MNEKTANNLVAIFMVGGIVLALIRKSGSDTPTTYKRIWGTSLLGLGGAALAGFVPQLVGPYFLLVIIAYVAGNFGKVSGAVNTLKSQAGVSKP